MDCSNQMVRLPLPNVQNPRGADLVWHDEGAPTVPVPTDTSLKVFAACVHGSCHRMILVDFQDRSRVQYAGGVPPDTRAIILASQCPRHGPRMHGSVRELTDLDDIEAVSGYYPFEACDITTLPNGAIWKHQHAVASAVMGGKVEMLTPEMSMAARDAAYVDPANELAATLSMMAVGGVVVFEDMIEVAAKGGEHFAIYSVDACLGNSPSLVLGSPNEGPLSRLRLDDSYPTGWWSTLFAKSGGAGSYEFVEWLIGHGAVDSNVNGG